MLKNILTYFVLLFNLIQFLLTEVNCFTFKPTLRHLHAATYVDNKLYILSGLDDNVNEPLGATGIGGRQFFYLDVSAPFNTSELVWNDLSNDNIVPSQIGSTAVKGGANNDTIILYGGRNLTQIESKPLVYTFNTQTDSWSVPAISGESFVKRRSLTAIIDNKGKIYLFGGKLLGTDSYVNDMITLDTINLNWGTGSTQNAPSERINYGATLLPDQNIIYIGGGNNLNESLSLNEVYIYDTKNDIWSTKVTTGSIPFRRYGLSAVLGLDGEQVIVFGGVVNPDTIISPGEALYTLNINTFEWSIPNVSGNTPNCRFMHKANVIGNYMVVTFGAGYNESESDVLLLDISNNNEFVWTTDFYPPPGTPVSAPPPVPPPPPKSLVIGLSVGAILLGAIAIGMLFLFRRNRNRKVKVSTLHIPNGKLDNQSGQKTVETTNKVDNQEETTQVQP